MRDINKTRGNSKQVMNTMEHNNEKQRDIIETTLNSAKRNPSSGTLEPPPPPPPAPRYLRVYRLDLTLPGWTGHSLARGSAQRPPNQPLCQNPHCKLSTNDGMMTTISE